MSVTTTELHDRIVDLEREATRGRLLKKYAERDAKDFVQYDVFHPEEPDSLFGLWTVELMRGTPCRVLIDPETVGADAAAMLRRVADWIDRDGLIEKPDPNEELPF